MSPTKTFYCIADDTALITNISEIEAWVMRGAIALVVPLHTLERLHLLKKDTSQIGQNARKAVKFLDEATSNADAKVLIQEPDDQYPTWAEVEAHYIEATSAKSGKARTANGADSKVDENMEPKITNDSQDHVSTNEIDESKDSLPQSFAAKLNMSKEGNPSPLSTPPLSPSSSGPQSSKTSPEVKSATIITNDLSPVPPMLKALINPVVWYSHEKKTTRPNQSIVFLTNSSDTAHLTRDFGVACKNIHQLRTAIGIEEQEAKNHDKYQKKHGSSPKAASEPRTLFRYEEEESDEEEVVVFKPRGRVSSRGASTARAGNNGSVRSRGHGHSPANSLNGLPQPVVAKPQIPTEEIDPDSFDRGSFARGNTPLISVGNHPLNTSSPGNRGSQQRGNHGGGGSSRGGHWRGNGRGADRGSTRARGRLFVP